MRAIRISSVIGMILLAGCTTVPSDGGSSGSSSSARPCTMEAKLCPDGSSVGRTGPDCDFAPCPGESSSSSAMSAASASSSATTGELRHYEDPGIGYGINVPASWTTAEDKEINTENYQATGTAFVPPDETGTTLDEAFFHVAQVESCPALPDSDPVTLAGTTFQRALWNGAGAGNLYQGVTYAGPKDAGCLVLTGYLHSCNLGSDCGENHSAPFDKDAYLSTFDAMAQSIQFLGHPGD